VQNAPAVLHTKLHKLVQNVPLYTILHQKKTCWHFTHTYIYVYMHIYAGTREPRQTACFRVVRPINFWNQNSGSSSYSARLLVQVQPNSNSTTAMDSSSSLPEIRKQEEHWRRKAHALLACARQLPFFPPFRRFQIASNSSQSQPCVSWFPPALYIARHTTSFCCSQSQSHS
jgi:hypothetical protein